MIIRLFKKTNKKNKPWMCVSVYDTRVLYDQQESCMRKDSNPEYIIKAPCNNNGEREAEAKLQSSADFHYSTRTQHG